MSDTETKIARVRAIRDFTDAGTERFFAKGKSFELTEEEAANYAAAGLIEVEEVPAPDAGDATASRKRA